MSREFRSHFIGPSSKDIFLALAERFPPPSGEIEVRTRGGFSFTRRWQDLLKPDEDLSIRWNGEFGLAHGGSGGIVNSPGWAALFLEGRAMTDPSEIAALLDAVPFSVCNIGATFKDQYRRKDTGRLPFIGVLGYAMILRGADGHAHFPSRRWLGHSPWNLIRFEKHDDSFLQFHDPNENDEAVTLEQARPAYARVVGPTGGYVEGPKADLPRGAAWDADGVLTVQAKGVVPQADMQRCASARWARGGGRVRFVFDDPQLARIQLHELWLRDFEVYTADGTRLDRDHKPVREVPGWVAAVAARESR